MSVIINPETLTWSELPVWAIDVLISTWPKGVSRPPFSFSIANTDAFGETYFELFFGNKSFAAFRSDARLLYRRRAN